jgi:hypothetical protein
MLRNVHGPARNALARLTIENGGVKAMMEHGEG